MIVKKMIKAILNPKKAIRVLLENLLNFSAPYIKDDKKFIKMKWRLVMNYPLNLNSPQTFNEKMQWLKLYNRKLEYSKMVDKVDAKIYVANIIGSEYIIPTLAVYNNVEDIDFNELPNRFVLKCTHNSNALVICKDKSAFNKEEAKEKLKKGLRKTYFYYNREWPYKNVTPRIIAEEYMENSKKHDLKDYKFFCFNGRALFFKIDYDRFVCHKANYFDMNLRLLPYGEQICPPDFNRTLVIPNTIGEMARLAEKLSLGHPFLRVDFYDVGGKIYFGEMTFFPASGFGLFTDFKYDKEIGNLLKLN